VQQPLLDAQVLAELLHVGDQMFGGVAAQVRGRIGRMLRPQPRWS
jgi:hypothetical protein